MAENRKFSSRRDSPGQSVFKQDLFLLSVPSGSATPRVLAVDDEGRVISVVYQGGGAPGSNGTSGSSGGSV